MHPFERHIQDTVDRHGLLRRSSPVIVALSGGADSVALLSALCALGYDCIAAHCNFHLRGAESNRDMRHAQAIAKQLDVNIYIKEFDVAKRTKQTGESIEMACRELRYTWFHELLDRDYSQAIAVGHHREDNIETFFINLFRSSGLTGLTGMDYRRGFVVRPMLDLSRSQIEDYLSDVGLQYITDSSNNQNDFRRNRLRNIIIPTLESHFPGASEAVLSTMSNLRDSQLIVNYAIERTVTEVGATQKSIDVSRLLRTHGLERGKILLFELIRQLGLNASQTEDIVRAVSSHRTGLRFDIDSSRFAELDRGILTFHNTISLPHAELTYLVSLKHDILHPINIHITPHNILEFNPERNPDVMYLEAKALDGNPLFELRHPQTGDRMIPYGMTGEKLISDILKDAKYSAAQKRNTWLLTRNGKILWIVGLRASASFTITPNTRSYLRLQYIK